MSTFIPEQSGWSNLPTDDKMLPSDILYTKLRWLFTIAGLFLYVGDILTDIRLAVKYFQESHFVWTGLTLMFVLAGLLVTQVFSHTWYRDDMTDVLMNAEGKPPISGLSKGGLVFLHLFGMGIFTRYDFYKSSELYYYYYYISCSCGMHVVSQNRWNAKAHNVYGQTGITTYQLQQCIVECELSSAQQQKRKILANACWQ